MNPHLLCRQAGPLPLAPSTIWEEPLGGQETNWRTIIPKKFSHCFKSSRLHSRLPNLGIWQKRLRIPKEFDFESPWDLIRTSTGLGRKESLEGHKQNLVCTRTQEKGTVTPKETESYLPVSVQESPMEAWINIGLSRGQGH